MPAVTVNSSGTGDSFSDLDGSGFPLTVGEKLLTILVGYEGFQLVMGAPKNGWFL